MTNTTGYIYFAIKTEDSSVSINTFNKFISLSPTSFKLKGEKNGKTPVCTSWKYSTGNLTNPFFAGELDELIKTLSKHTKEFKKLKDTYPEFHFVLQVVSYIGDETPGLSFSKNVLDFVNQTSSVIDCDFYNAK